MKSITLPPSSIRGPVAQARILVAVLSAAAGNAWAQGEIFVANGDSGIKVYARTASGNTAPVRVIAGASTGFNGVSEAAPDTVHNELAVANCNPGSVLIFALTANGDVAPTRTISAPRRASVVQVT
jgi:hypothetical protein